MCGIAGALGVLESGSLEKMAQRISHRGPDNIGVYSNGSVHMAHTRLSIIDLHEASNQPLWDAAHRACIVFNGEIYNYKELRQSLIEQGVIFVSTGDAEVLLNLYLRSGVDCLEQLHGIFAFAIWDEQKQSLFIGRDRFGVKPFYYASTPETFCFASEIKALLEVKQIKRTLNYDALFRSLVFLWSPGEETLIKEVKKLPPAHYAIITKDMKVNPIKYWDWPVYDPIQGDDPKFHMARILTAFEESVEEQLVADVEVGAFLSGGLDSSLVVLAAKRRLGSRLKCFTIDARFGQQNQEGFVDDLPYAKKVAEYVGVDLEVVNASPDVCKMLPTMIYHLDEMQADPAPLNVLLICQLAREKGIKVLLSGAGGDDVFSGYRRHYAVSHEKYWSWLPYGVRRCLSALSQLAPKSNPLLRRIAKALRYSHLSETERLLSYFYWIDPEVVRGLFRDPSQLSSDPLSSIKHQLEESKTTDPLERMLEIERRYFLVDHNFNYTDKMSMAVGVEVRVPFLDQKLAAVAANIPSKFKQKGREGKWILKEAACKFLPKSIVYRPKTGFGAPLRSWLNNELVDMVNDLLSKERVEARGVFTYEKVQELIALDRSGKEDYSYPIFALLCFELWCQHFMNEAIK